MSKTTLKIAFHASRLEEVAAALAALGDLSRPAHDVQDATSEDDASAALVDAPATTEDDYPWHLFAVTEYAPLFGDKPTFDTARAVLDYLTERAGQWVDYKEVHEATGRTGVQQGAVTRWAKSQGLETPWRRRWTRTTGDAGDTSYMLTEEAADNWRQARSHHASA